MREFNPRTHSLVLVHCDLNGRGRDGLQWPLSVGEEAAHPDWKPTAESSNGLLGWLHGLDIHGVTPRGLDRKWLVVETESAGIVMLDGLCKFRRATVRFAGGLAQAAEYLRRHEPKCDGGLIVGEAVAAGSDGVAHAGARGIAAAGAGGLVSAGVFGMAAAGDRGRATAGLGGIAATGDGGAATTGYGGVATAGDNGTATAGNAGIATTGACGTAAAGVGGMAAAGAGGSARANEFGIAIAGNKGTAMAGAGGVICIERWDPKQQRRRIAVGYVGAKGLKPNVAYRLNEDDHAFVETESAGAAIPEDPCGFPSIGTPLIGGNEAKSGAGVRLGVTVLAGDAGTARAGAFGIAAAGEKGIAAAGDNGTAGAGIGGAATAGAHGTAVSGDHGTATAGDKGTARAGDHGTASAGAKGTAVAGAMGVATVGDEGTAIAGDGGTAVAGAGGTAKAGDGGTVMAGDGGLVILRQLDPGREWQLIKVGGIGENGLKPDTPYRLDGERRFVAAQ